MQPDVTTPPTAGEGRVRRRAARKRETTSYVSETMGGIGQTIGYYLRQPMVIGSLAIAMIGATVGVRVAQMQAMQRRRSFFERSMETLGSLGAIALTVMRIRRRRMMMRQILQERGQDIAETTRGWRGMMMQNVPPMGRVRMRARGARSMARQVGFALSLIPVTMAFLRNPLVRDVGFRMLSRRATRRMGLGIARGLIRR